MSQSIAPILIIDDDLILAQSIQDVLEVIGYESKSIHDGGDALEYLESHTPALILLDMHLPNVGGMQILQNLKNNNRFDDTQVVVMTADKALKKKSEQYTMALQKPILADKLVEIVESFLSSET